MRHFKNLLILGVLLCLTLCIFGCSSKDPVTEISSVSFTRSSDFILDGNTEGGYLRTEGTDEVTVDMIKIVIEDESIVTAKILKSSGHLVSFELTPVSKGETYIYAATSDGNIASEKLKVTVKSEALQSEVEETDTYAESTTALSADTYPLKSPETTATETKYNEQSADVPAEKYYVLNTNTKKLHHPDCSSVDKISPKNYGTTDDAQSKLDEGYVWCKLCGK